MEEDDMVMRVGNSLSTETNRWGRKEAASLRSL